ncbi:hypothetical protein OAG71_00535 [bacterium]|nr:hypothetical protein [bacterium]
MNQDSRNPRRWQFGLGSLFFFTTVAGPVAGLFFGAFGENNRAAAVNALVIVSDYVFPLSWIAMTVLITLGLVRLLGRLTGTDK